MKAPAAKKQNDSRFYIQTAKEDDHLPISIAIFLFISLLFISYFFEYWDNIPFRGVDLSQPEISEFQDVNM
jgi:hypothetical protein